MTSTKNVTKVDNIKKAQWLKTYKNPQLMGNITTVCETIEIARATYYKWLEEDESFRELVAESVEQAREVARAEKAASEAESERLSPIYKEHYEWERKEDSKLGGYSSEMWRTPEGKAILARRPKPSRNFVIWDGSDEALDREPDTVLDIDTPKVVAFNGGGYD